jgi:hypothetical protein
MAWPFGFPAQAYDSDAPGVADQVSETRPLGWHV